MIVATGNKDVCQDDDNLAPLHRETAELDTQLRAERDHVARAVLMHRLEAVERAIALAQRQARPRRVAPLRATRLAAS